MYWLAFATIPIFMFKAVYDVSQSDHPGFHHYKHLLDDGWIPGRQVDNSDPQYASFRDNIPYMAVLLVVHPLTRKAYERFFASEHSSEGKPANGSPSNGALSHAADARLNTRISFDLGFAIVLSLALHGVSAAKVFIILYLNYQIATKLPKPSAAATTWIFNIGILFANELCQGYKFADIAAYTLPSTTTAADKPPADNWGTWVDTYGGLIPRWEILFNITVLRLIAFNFDYLWMLDRRASSPIEVRPS